jgi:hypothetical protein
MIFATTKRFVTSIQSIFAHPFKLNMLSLQKNPSHHYMLQSYNPYSTNTTIVHVLNLRFRTQIFLYTYYKVVKAKIDWGKFGNPLVNNCNIGGHNTSQIEITTCPQQINVLKGKHGYDLLIQQFYRWHIIWYQ